MTDRYGTFEHAEHAVPRREHGYCVDDVARVLVVASREPQPVPRGRRSWPGSPSASWPTPKGVTGRTRNRRSADGRWHGRRGVDDCWGRSVWGLGTAAARATGYPADSARTLLRPRRPAALALAAGDGVRRPRCRRGRRRRTRGAQPARSLLEDAADLLLGLGAAAPDAGWTWPEARLTYANAALPDALLAAGHALGPADAGRPRASSCSAWLLERETVERAPVGHPRRRGGPRTTPAPGFDQQPIEVATMADACARAAAPDRRSPGGSTACGWPAPGSTATTTPAPSMWDPATGGGYDGLQADGPNRNQGAESTLALDLDPPAGRTASTSSRHDGHRRPPRSP